MGVAELGRRTLLSPGPLRDAAARSARLVLEALRRGAAAVRTTMPLTTTGTVVLTLGVLAYLGGWRLGWIELMVVAAGCLIAAAIAVPFVVGRLRLEVTRRLAPERVTVGDPAVAELRVTNDTKHGVGPRIVEDRVGDRAVRVELPGLAAGGSTQALYDLPTSRRGRYAIGPATIAKADPLGLLRREVTQTTASTLWVHPHHVTLPALPVGFAKDLEGPTSDASPAGDVSFHTLREYQVGDDYRHIHWLSTARAGTTMVRHYVDNRRPHLGVLVDDRAEAYPGDRFELAVSVAASLGVSTALHRQPLSITVGNEPVVRGRDHLTTDAVLDALTLVQPGTGSDLPTAAAQLLRRERGTSALVVVTGNLPTTSLLATVQSVRRSCRVIVVRLHDEGRREPGSLPGATVFDVDGLPAFRLAWERLVR